MEDHESVKELVASLDAVYMDTTFISSAYRYFPTERESIQEIVGFIDQDRKNQNGSIFVLRPPGAFNHDELYSEIVKKFGKIHVSGSCVRDLIHVPDSEKESKFCIGECECGNGHSIHLCPPEEGSAYDYWDHRDITCDPDANNIFIIRPVACKHQVNMPPGRFGYSDRNWVHYFCYANHCSRNELEQFILYLRPTSVFPNVIPSGRTREGVNAKLQKILAGMP